MKKLIRLLLLCTMLAGSTLACTGPFRLWGRPTPTPPAAESLPPTRPVLLQRSPARGEEAPVDSELVLTFDQPMDRAATEAAFSIEPAVAGTFSWPDATTLVFRPRGGWERATRYRVKIDISAKSSAGLPLRQEVELSFATVGYLEVTQVIPEPDAQEIEPDATITVMFNRPVVPLQLVSAAVADVPVPLEITPPVEGRGEWLNTSIYVFTPAEGFTAGQTYRARVPAGLSDTTGGVLEEDFTWSFTIQSPYVVWTVPASGDYQVPLTQPITVTFSQPMDRASTQAAFSLTTADGATVPGRFSWSEGDTVMTFTPSTPLELETPYSAAVDSTARAAAGEATLREAYRWPFQTVPYPAIVSTTPANGDPEVDPSTSLEIVFSAPMDIATLMPNITIQPAPTRVYTYWNDYDDRFVVSWDIQPSTTYVVRLGGAMADPYGNTIGQDRLLRFTTRALDPLAYLAVPGDVGTYNAYTSTRVYVIHRNVNQVDLALYRLDWETFRRLTGPDRWQRWDSFTPRREATLLREWTVPVDAPLNEAGYLQVYLAEDNGALTPGLYFLEVTAPEVSARGWGTSRHILVVSRTHLTLKLAQREALVWATDLATGAPVSGLNMRLLTPDGAVLAQGRSDADGVLTVEYEPLYDLWGSYLAVAGEPGGRDFAVASINWYDGIGPWDFGYPAEFWFAPYRFYLYTDRPIYRPGQPVYFRGILRAEDDARYSLPPARGSVEVVIYDEEGQQVYGETLSLSDLSTFHGEFTLGQETDLGYYTIEARFGEQSGSVGFQVAEYRRPEFEVTVTAGEEEVLSGATVDVVVEARYFFGGPVTDAHVYWALLSQDYAFRPDVPGWWDWHDTSRWDWWREEEVPGYGRFVADGEGRTDSQGRLLLSVPADIADQIMSQRMTVEATVTDINDQAVSGRTSFLVHKGLYYIGLQPTRYVGQVGQPQQVQIRTVDWEGQARGGDELLVTFSNRQWLNVQQEDEYGNLYWTWTPSDTVVFSQTVTTDRSGEAVASFVPAEGGTFIVKAQGRDQAGNTVTSATWLWVSSSEYVSWRQENNDRIQLVADRRQYAPGDTAQILVPSPFQGEVTALFTVERGRIIEHWVQTLAGNAETVALPIRADFAPNVYLSVVLVKGVDETNPAPAYRVGYVALDVSAVEQTLTVTITPDRGPQEHYGPRETVRAEIAVTDAAGNPVEAEVSLAVVDEAVLSLADPNAPAITEAFYGKRGLGVRTADSLVLNVDRINVRMAAEGKGGGGGGEMAVGYEFIRQEFPDTAYWAPDIRTDAQGRATVEFRLPDQLTTWNLDARAVTADTLVGQTEIEILSTKDLLVRPVTPRFFVVGDRADLAAVVHNNTATELEVEVWLDAEGVTLLGDERYEITIPAGGRERVEWPVEVQDVEWVDLVFHAEGGGYADAVKPTAGLPPDQLLPVYRYSTPEVVGTAGELADEGAVLEGIVIPDWVDTSQGEVTVRIEPSLAAGMTEGLDYLEHYPYECTEQVVSRFLPNVLTFRALRELGLQDADLEASLREQIAIGLQRLYARQHYDGGWGWWVNDESNTLVSAYVVLGMLKAQEAGFGVDENVITRGVDYLTGQLGPTARLREREQADRQAFVLYVLAEAGAVRSGDLVSLYDLRARLSHYGRAYLGLAFGLLDPSDPRLGTLFSDLSSAAILSATGARWQESEPDRWNWNTDTRTTAIVLDLLARFDPDNALAPNVVRWLMHARQEGHWETTQETAWALIALTDWMVATGELEGRYRWGVRLNGADAGEGTVTPETVRQVTELQFAVADLLLGQANRLEIARSEGSGMLYYTAHLRAYLPVERVSALNRGIVIGRRYEMADCTEGCEPISSAEVGDVVRVRLTLIAPNDLNYVVIEDPFPAGAEPVDTSLRTTSVVGERPELRRVGSGPLWWYWGWGWWWFSNTDLRDEKLTLFATSLPAGTYEYTYLLQIGMAGEYRVLPPTAYEMYFPEVMGRGDGMLFTITR